MCHREMRGLDGSPLDVAMKNLREAMRAAELVKEEQSALLPTPLTLLRAELRNVQRYLELAKREAR